MEIPIEYILPSEWILCQEDIDAIRNRHYRGKVEDIRPIEVWEFDNEYYLDEGNKRSFLLHILGHQLIRAHVHDPRLQPELFEETQDSIDLIQMIGVQLVEDILVLPGSQYEQAIRLPYDQQVGFYKTHK